MIEGMQPVLAAKRRFHPVRAKRDAHRQEAAGDSLGNTHNVRRNVGQVARKHFSRPPESGQNFIRDQKNIVLRAQRANLLKKFDRMNDHAARTLQQRFNNNRRDFVRSLSQKMFQLLNAFDVAGFALQTNRTAVAIRRMHPMHQIPHGLKGLREGRFIAHRHRPGRIAVVPVL